MPEPGSEGAESVPQAGTPAPPPEGPAPSAAPPSAVPVPVPVPGPSPAPTLTPTPAAPQIATACPSCKAVFRLAAAARHRPGACPFCAFRFFIREGMGDLIIEGGEGKRALATCDCCKVRAWIHGSSAQVPCPLCKVGFISVGAGSAAEATHVPTDDPFAEPPLAESPLGSFADAIESTVAPIARHVPEPRPLGRYEPPPAPRYHAPERHESHERLAAAHAHRADHVGPERSAPRDDRDDRRDRDERDDRRDRDERDARESGRRRTPSGERAPAHAPRPSASGTRRGASPRRSTESVILLVGAIAFLLGASVGFSAGALVFRGVPGAADSAAGAGASTATIASAGPSVSAEVEAAQSGPLWSRERKGDDRRPRGGAPDGRRPDGALPPPADERERGAEARGSSSGAPPGASAGAASGKPGEAAGGRPGAPTPGGAEAASLAPPTESEDVLFELTEIARHLKNLGPAGSVARGEAAPRVVAALEGLGPVVEASLPLSRALAALLEKNRKELLDDGATQPAVTAALAAHARRFAAAASGPAMLKEARAAAERAALADLLASLDARIAAVKLHPGEVRQQAQRTDQRARRAKAREEALAILRIRASRAVADPEGLARLRERHAKELQRTADACLAAGDPGLAFDLLRALVTVEPQNRRARTSLGETRFGELWLRPFEAQQRAAGLAWSRDRGWMIATDAARYEAGEHYDVAARRWARRDELETDHADAANPWLLETEHFVLRSTAPLSHAARLLDRMEPLYLSVFRRCDLVFAARGDELGQRLVHGTGASRRLDVRLFKDDAQLRGHATPPPLAGAGFYAPSKGALLLCSQGGVIPAPTIARELARQMLVEIAGRGDGPTWLEEGAVTELEDALDDAASPLEAPDDLSRRPTIREYRDRLRAGEPEMRLRECIAATQPRRLDDASAARARRGAGAVFHFLLTFDDGRFRADAVEMLRDACRGAPQPIGLYFGLAEETLDALMDRFYRSGG